MPENIATKTQARDVVVDYLRHVGFEGTISVTKIEEKADWNGVYFIVTLDIPDKRFRVNYDSTLAELTISVEKHV